MGAMDISVSHLNNRLSIQLPQELPLGLVFVTGTVSFSDSTVFTELVAHGRYKHIHFDLTDDRYRIRCVLVVRAMLDYDVELGSRVRVGGHLRFDSQRADYYLLARDLERLDEDVLGEAEEIEADQEEVAALLADIRKRTSKQQIPTDLPEWVQNLAPESMQQEADLSDEPELELSEANSELSEEASEAALVSSISALLDEVEDIELTPEMIHSMEDDEGVVDTMAIVEDVPAETLVRDERQTAVSQGPDWLILTLMGILVLIVLISLGVFLFS